MAAVKVAVLGASGGAGQPLSLLLKLNPLVTELFLYDIVHTPGVVADLSHIDKNSSTECENGPDALNGGLSGTEIVVISGGVARKPGMTRENQFKLNACMIRYLCNAIGKYCPSTMIAIITNPVNSCVPIAAETLKKCGVYDPKKIFGVTTLDVVRSKKFVGNLKGLDPSTIDVPVIGGHSGFSGESIVPILSQCKPKVELTDSEIACLTKRIQNAGTEVVLAKAGAGSATLSMAYAAYRLVDSFLRAIDGEPDVVECSYVEYHYEDLNYFSLPLLLGPNGVEKHLGVPPLTQFECKVLQTAIPVIKEHIQKGEEFMLAS